MKLFRSGFWARSHDGPEASGEVNEEAIFGLRLRSELDGRAEAIGA